MEHIREGKASGIKGIGYGDSKDIASRFHFMLDNRDEEGIE